MPKRLLKNFVRWLLNLEWKEARALFYPNDHAPLYLAEKRADFERDRFIWFCHLDDNNERKAYEAVMEAYHDPS